MMMSVRKKNKGAKISLQKFLHMPSEHHASHTSDVLSTSKQPASSDTVFEITKALKLGARLAEYLRSQHVISPVSFSWQRHQANDNCSVVLNIGKMNAIAFFIASDEYNGAEQGVVVYSVPEAIPTQIFSVWSKRRNVESLAKFLWSRIHSTHHRVYFSVPSFVVELFQEIGNAFLRCSSTPDLPADVYKWIEEAQHDKRSERFGSSSVSSCQFRLQCDFDAFIELVRAHRSTFADQKLRKQMSDALDTMDLILRLLALVETVNDELEWEELIWLTSPSLAIFLVTLHRSALASHAVIAS